MPENEFEKKVQQRLDELKLNPSEEVWKEVELRIKKEKKKRRAFLWLPLLFLMLGGGLVLIMKLNNNNHIAQPAAEINKSQKDNSNIQKQVLNKTSVSKTNSENPVIEKDKQVSNDQQNSNEAAKLLVAKENDLQKTKLVKKEKTASEKSVLKETVSAKSIIKNEQDKQGNEFGIANNKIADQQLNQEKDTIASKAIAIEEKSKDVQLQKKDSAESLNDLTLKATKEKSSIRLHKKQGKWQWGIMLEIGRAQVANGPNFFDKNYYTADAFANVNAPAGGPVYPSYTQSPIHPSASFGATVNARRSISRKFDINLGLGYTYLSTKMNVGSKVDSSLTLNRSASSFYNLSNFYRASGNNLSYTNSYHFIDLSVGLSWKIISNKKLSISWENRLSFDRLLFSNALHFDGSLPGYYKNNDFLIHNHVFLSTGFSIPVFKGLALNPFAEYSLTSVLKNSSSSKIHFTNYGIRVNFLLKNKK